MRSILQNIQYQGRIRIGYVSAFFLMLLSFLLSMYANNRLIKNAEKVEHTNSVISNLEAMLSKVKDAETGFRGFVISNNIHFLDPYFGSRKAADSIYRETVTLISDNKVQLNHLYSIKQNMDLKFSQIENRLKDIQKNNGLNPTIDIVAFIQSKDVMDIIRKEVLEMQVIEKKLLLERNIKLSKTSDAVSSIVIASIILSFFLVVFGFSSHLKESKERMQAEEKVKVYENVLKKRIEELALANTELKQMRSQEKFAATGRIARTIAHEIRNPLTNINLAAEQLSSEMPAGDENTHFLFDMINRNSNRINMLISDLLNSTKFSELQFQKVSINELIDETLTEAQDRIALNDVTLIKKYAEDICDITADKEKIKIAFLNIIINAIEAMDGKKEAIFTIETKKEEDKCIVRITDTGTGMDEESVSKLFEPYFTNKQNGNGLGLTNTQNIILNHKGNIYVESKLGSGTCFIITLNID